MRALRLGATIVSILSLVMSAACSTHSIGSATAKPPAEPKPVTKLLVFVVENHSLGQMRAEMPYTYSLAKKYAHATRYYGVTHPSLPNYLAMVGGRTFGVTDNRRPKENPVVGRSVFSAALRHGLTAKVYAEGMPADCATDNGGDHYAVRHNPWAYFVDERDQCRDNDVPFAGFDAAVHAGRLPNAGMVVPDTCHDAHDCDLEEADAWFEDRMQTVFAGPDWRSGRLAVVLTADEDDSDHDNRVLTVVIHPSQHHHVVRERLDHYALAGLYADVVGAPRPGEAAKAPSMAAAFGLPVE